VLFALGAEVCTQEAALAKKIQEILDHKRKYLESAIRDAHAAGLINVSDAAAKARTLFTYYEGQLTEARIQNNLDVLREQIRGTYELLGIHEPAPAVK
jgi:TetR/AcrR family transcriptional repressor of nem operon